MSPTPSSLGAVEFEFSAPVIEWRGPSPYYYLPVPEEESADIAEIERATGISDDEPLA